MGNTLARHHEGNAPEVYNGNDDEILLRKKIHNILLNQKQIINGREIYINRRKTYCRVNKLGDERDKPHNTDMSDNDFLNIALPRIVNIVPSFTYQNADTPNTINPTAKIQTYYLPLQVHEDDNNNYKDGDDYNNTESGEIQKNLYDIGTCNEDIQEICAKQIYDNNCITYKNGKWVWNSNNQKCFTNDLDQQRNRKITTNYQNIKDIQLSDDTLKKYDYLCKFLQNGDETRNISLYDDDFIISVNADIHELSNWAERPAGKYYNKLRNMYSANDQDNMNIIFTRGDIRDVVRDTGSTLTSNLYKKIQNMIIVNFLNVFEHFYINELYSDQILYSGEPLCACLNSVYGENLNTYPRTDCQIRDENHVPLGKEALIDILNSSDEPEWRKKAARRCLQWDVKFLADYDENGAVSSVKNQYMSPQQCSAFINNWPQIRHNHGSTTQTILDKQSRLCTQASNVLRTSVKINMFKHLKPDMNYDIRGESIYSMKLDGISAEEEIDPYRHDKRCKNKVLTSSKPEQQPYYSTSLPTLSDTYCINQINFNNVNAGNINISNILQNNTCGNLGTVNQYFIKPNEYDGNSYSQCPSGQFSGIFLSGFNLNINTNNTLSYSLFSNINGYYVYNVDNSDVDRYSIYENFVNPSIILIISHNTNNKATFGIYNMITGNPNPKILSREFSYNPTSAEQNTNEEMCIDRQMKDIYVFKKYLDKLGARANRESIINDFLDNNQGIINKINPTRNSNEPIDNFNTFVNTIPNYGWLSEERLTSTSQMPDEYGLIDGIISQGNDTLFNTDISTRFFGTDIDEFRSHENKLYLYEVGERLENPITGIGQFIMDNNTLTPYIVIEDIHADVNIINARLWENVYVSRSRESLLGDIALAGVNPLSTVLDITRLLEKAATYGKTLIIYSPYLYRYLLFDGLVLVGASDIVYDISLYVNEELEINSINIYNIPDEMIIPYGISKEEGEDRIWKLTNLETINTNIGQLITNDIVKLYLQRNDNNPFPTLTLENYSLDKNTDYFYEYSHSRFKNITIKLDNNAWYILIEDAKILVTNQGDLNILNEDISWSNFETGVSVNSDTFTIYPATSFVIRFIFNNAPQNQRNHSSVISSFKNMITDYFNIDDENISYVDASTKKSPKADLYWFLWIKFSIDNILELTDDKRNIINFIKYIYDDDYDDGLELNEVTTVKKMPESRTDAADEQTITDRYDNEIRENTDNLFNQGDVVEYSRANYEVGTFKLILSRNVNEDVLKEIIENALAPITNFPIKLTLNQSFNNTVEGFTNNNNYYYIENFGDDEWVIEYKYEPDGTPFGSNDRNEIGPISLHTAIKNDNGDWPRNTEPSLKTNVSRPVGRIINSILSELREVSRHINIVLLSYDYNADYSERVFRELYSSEDDPNGDFIRGDENITSDVPVVPDPVPDPVDTATVTDPIVPDPVPDDVDTYTVNDRIIDPTDDEEDSKIGIIIGIIVLIIIIIILMFMFLGRKDDYISDYDQQYYQPYDQSYGQQYD